MKKNRLGKGLGALIPNLEEHTQNTNLMELDPKLIKTNPFQPRQIFNQNALDDLKKSIKENGLIQPLAVRKTNGFYELIAGERRLRSVIELGFDKVPVFLIDIETKEEMLELAIIENIQRENLNIIEQANAFQQLIDECNLTIEKMAQKLGKDRSTINNILRILKLPKQIQKMLEENKLSYGHARTIINVENLKEQLALANQIVSEDLSVRKVEEIIKNKNLSKTNKQSKKDEIPIFYKKIENDLRQKLATQVRIKSKNEGGIIELEFYSDDDLLRLKEIIN